MMIRERLEAYKRQKRKEEMIESIKGVFQSVAPWSSNKTAEEPLLKEEPKELETVTTSVELSVPRVPRGDPRVRFVSWFSERDMATMIDSLITCPYDETHRIARESLPIHLVKCGRNNSSSTKVICPFDVTHVIDDSYYERHLCNCASSGNVKNYKYSLERERPIGVVSWEVVTKASIPFMKDWQETEVESYDPWKSTENRDVIRYLFVASKSKKREFRLAERRRLQALECRKFAIDFPKKSESFQTIHKSSKKHVQDVLSDFVKKMKKLSVNDVDLILETIDIGKLHISEPKVNLKERKAEMIEKVLVKALKNMVLNSSKNEIV